MSTNIANERRAALLMLRKHGPIAQTRAMQLAKERSKQGDTEGWSLWLRIYKAIDELQYRSGTPLPSL